MYRSAPFKSLFNNAFAAIALAATASAASAQQPATRPTAPDSTRPAAAATRLAGDTIRAAAPTAARGYRALRSRTATRTDTPLHELPQSVSVVTRPLMADHAMRALTDVVPFLPGVQLNQGEGNRDAIVMRGNTATGDLFLDGLRDDVQYLRDLYNVERVEALKGPDALAFGRGGAGGVINRVTREATGAPVRALEVQGGAWNERRVTGDLGAALTPRLAARVSALLEQDDAYRAFVSSRREGLAPTIAWQAAPRTRVALALERYRDERTADRGIPSLAGAPLDPAAFTTAFFGDPAASFSRVAATHGTLSLVHVDDDGTRLESRLRVGAYDKGYRNVYAAGAVQPATGTVALGAYDGATIRESVFWQADATGVASTGPLVHRWRSGVEASWQRTDNVRRTGFFNDTAATWRVNTATPTVALPLGWRGTATDANNIGVATGFALVAQDQVQLTPWAQAVLGLRLDQFGVQMTDRRTGAALASRDVELSPRVGFVLTPSTALSLYANWSRAFAPRAGDQLASLTASTQALAPESFTNVEAGLKWQRGDGVALTAAAYDLRRRNVAVADPTDATRTVLADALRVRGIELGLEGQVTARWSVAGGYAFQDGAFTQDVSATVRAGNAPSNLPRHTLTLWHRVELTHALAVGAGVQHAADFFAATDNAVRVPGSTRVNAALYARLGAGWSAQVNLENLLDARYVTSATNNNNLMPGAPRFVRLVLRWAD